MESIITDILVVSKPERTASAKTDQTDPGIRILTCIQHLMSLATEHFLKTFKPISERDDHAFGANNLNGFQRILGFISGNGVAFRNMPAHKFQTGDYNIWRFKEFDWEKAHLVRLFNEAIVLIVCPWYIELKKYMSLVDMAHKLNAGTLLFDRPVKPAGWPEFDVISH